MKSKLFSDKFEKKKKHVLSLMWPEWQMLSEIFNRVHFSRNFIFADCFASEASLNTQIKFSAIKYLNLYDF